MQQYNLFPILPSGSYYYTIFTILLQNNFNIQKMEILSETTGKSPRDYQGSYAHYFSIVNGL